MTLLLCLSSMATSMVVGPNNKNSSENSGTGVTSSKRWIGSPSQIRHAGRAHVRGKIRRVWRPRYLELLDQGIVQYYEFPSPSGPSSGGGVGTLHPTTEDWSWESFLWAGGGKEDVASGSLSQQQHLIPKYTLQISHARILDVTTLRDMHVGLPRGTFGFTFRGQRLLHLEQQQRAAAAANASASSLMGVEDKNSKNVTPVTLEPRDFLCAVTTLEEAQMWVVALQWAASERLVVESIHEMELKQKLLQHLTMDEVSIGTQESAGGFVNVTTANTQTPDPQHPEPPTLKSDYVTPSIPAADTAYGVRAKIVVTKVTSIRTVRLSLYHWEVAFEIHGLFFSSRDPSFKDDKSRAELWTALRTADDFLHLVHALKLELRTSTNVLDRVCKLILELPRLNYATQFVASPAAFHSNLLQAIARVDGILRNLVTDAHIVQTSAMKEFLGLSSSKAGGTQSMAWRFWEYHDGRMLVDRCVETVETLADVYVKQWLARRQRKPNQQHFTQPFLLDYCAAYVLQRPLYFIGYFSVSSVAAFWPLAKWAISTYYRFVPTFTVRADALVITWIGAAYLGYQFQRPPPVPPPPPRESAVPAETVPTKKELSPQTCTTQNIPHPEKERADTIHVPCVDDRTYDDDESSTEGEASLVAAVASVNHGRLPSPIPQYPDNDAKSCWSQPPHHIFHVRSSTYLKDRVKEPSGPAPLTCRGVDVWLTDNAERHIARHPAVLGGKLGEEDTFLVNFLLPFGNFVAYFSIPPLIKFPKKLRNVWTKFLKGDQQYRDARLKLLPFVAEGPWIVRAAVGPGKSPALLGKVIPLQYFFQEPDRKRKGIYEVDVIITASSIAKGILSVVKGNTKNVTLAFAFIIEASEQDELPETVLCSCQVHTLDLDQCPILPPCNLDETSYLEQE